jgi:hypothetical protein
MQCQLQILQLILLTQAVISSKNPDAMSVSNPSADLAHPGSGFLVRTLMQCQLFLQLNLLTQAVISKNSAPMSLYTT